MATFSLNQFNENKISTIDINLLIFIRFILCGKNDMKYEISVRYRIDPSTKLQFYPSRNRKVGQKLNFDPESKESRKYMGLVAMFWRQFVTYFFTNFF